MIVRQLTAAEIHRERDFFEASQRILRQLPHQTCVKVCSWDLSETIPNKPALELVVFAALQAERAVGILALDPKAWQICLLSVHQEVQGQGLSDELIRAAESYAKAHHQFQLSAVVLMDSVPFFLKLNYNLIRSENQPLTLQGRFFMRSRLRPKIAVAVEPFRSGIDCRVFSEMLESMTGGDCQIISCPLSSGARGYVDALVQQSAYKRQPITLTHGHQQLETAYATRGNNAVLELSSLSGQESSWNFGLQIQDALRRGCRRLFLALSERGPQDGGRGMLEALGAVFETASHGEILQADLEGLKTTIQGITFIALANTMETISDHPEHSTPYLRWLMQEFGTAPANEAGSLAGHGLGLSVLTLLRGTCVDATETLMRTIGFDSRIRNADCLILGSERKIAGRIHFNPVIQALRTARDQSIRTVLISADPHFHTEEGLRLGFDEVHSLIPDQGEEELQIQQQLQQIVQTLMEPQAASS